MFQVGNWSCTDGFTYIHTHYIYIFAYRPHAHAPSNVSNMAGWELPKLNGSVKKNILKVTELYHCHACFWEGKLGGNGSRLEGYWRMCVSYMKQKLNYLNRKPSRTSWHPRFKHMLQLQRACFDWTRETSGKGDAQWDSTPSTASYHSYGGSGI